MSILYGVGSGTEVSNISEVLKSVALLGEGIGLTIAGTEDVDFGGVDFDGLTGSGTLDNGTLDEKANTDVAALDDFVKVADLFLVDYVMRE